MKTRVLLIVLLVAIAFSGYAQKSNIRIGYIDTEYILENIPEYNEALGQLDQKVQKWKSEIDLKLRDIEKKKLDLRNESVLLTKELIEEKEEEIKIEDAEILDYQQKRFGPNGDLIIQKRTLIEPIQDQVLTAVRELAKSKKYDFIFDKSADVVMMYSNKRYDLSDYIVRVLTRASKRQQSKDRKSKKNAATEDVIPVINQEIAKVLANIVEFEIFFESSGNKFDIFIKHPQYDERPIEMASGAEKTMAAMAIRLALLSVSSLPKGDLFILDEPGTALDEENMEGFIRILELIKVYFKNVLLISHLDSLKDCVDMQIVIEKKAGYARVNQ